MGSRRTAQDHERRLLARAAPLEPPRWAGVLRLAGSVFDNKAPATQRERLWAAIREIHRQEWMLLTKRPQNIARYLPSDWGHGYQNVRFGVTSGGESGHCARPMIEDWVRRLRDQCAAAGVTFSISSGLKDGAR